MVVIIAFAFHITAAYDVSSSQSSILNIEINWDKWEEGALFIILSPNHEVFSAHASDSSTTAVVGVSQIETRGHTTHSLLSGEMNT